MNFLQKRNPEAPCAYLRSWPALVAALCSLVLAVPYSIACVKLVSAVFSFYEPLVALLFFILIVFTLGLPLIFCIGQILLLTGKLDKVGLYLTRCAAGATKTLIYFFAVFFPVFFCTAYFMDSMNSSSAPVWHVIAALLLIVAALYAFGRYNKSIAFCLADTRQRMKERVDVDDVGHECLLFPLSIVLAVLTILIPLLFYAFITYLPDVAGVYLMVGISSFGNDITDIIRNTVHFLKFLESLKPFLWVLAVDAVRHICIGLMYRDYRKMCKRTATIHPSIG